MEEKGQQGWEGERGGEGRGEVWQEVKEVMNERMEQKSV